jgi:prephenate dehydratase
MFAESGQAHSMKKRSPKIAFQGEPGAFSQQAIRQLLGDAVEPLPCQRFDEVFQALDQGRAEGAVIPIENTLHGSVHENYDHLLNFDFSITAETNVRIVHNLIAPPGVPFSRIRRVFSHPVALNQCLRFFARHPRIERVPYYDTAGSVKMVMAERLSDAGAIASALAGDIYGGRILRRSIEDDRRNYTRFFLLEKTGARKKLKLATPSSREYKTSLVFTTRNVPGALFRAISAFALRDLNLTKIESRPLRGSPWEYLFYVDLVGRVDDGKVRNALSHLEEIADFMRVLGSYIRA